MTDSENSYLDGIAIVGMAGRFPMAKNINEFWNNIKNGKECITFFEEDELIKAGIDKNMLKNPDYVKARGVLEDIDMFDASFFGVNPREAELMDPHHRILLECSFEALEDAGYDTDRYNGRIGIYAGQSLNSYMLLNVYPSIGKVVGTATLQAAIGNDKDSLTTNISYRLNLKGPGITIQSSSSTSLVAVCLACQSLLSYQCDMALAGGVAIDAQQKCGYLYQEGGIVSQDGHCRAFDAKSKGFVPGSGLGLVVLKRLEDAIADRDNIYAVIKGFAVNNDGSSKVSYAAPSVDAQAEVVVEAQAVAGVDPDTINYIEAHGTGTNMGDPIEVAALTQAFRTGTDKRNFCALGSVKTNMGHLDTAAGVIGLMKTALAIKNKLIPPTLHFKDPNPKIDFENSPFFINTEAIEWKRGAAPRRAGVTSLGMGGTNAHVVLEEYDRLENNGQSGEHQLLLLSAKTKSALETMTRNLGSYLCENRDKSLADIAYTLKVGRKELSFRKAITCRGVEEAIQALDASDRQHVMSSECEPRTRPITFMCTGQGSQYVNMARDLYNSKKVFRDEMDKCSKALEKHIGLSLLDLIFPKDDIEGAEEKLKETWITQPVLFAIEYSTARLWMSIGIHPQSIIGHSIGEYVAACLAGVFSLEDALELVAMRGKLMHGMPSGAMLVVFLTEKEIEELLEEELSLAAINAPGMCVVSGTFEAVERLEKLLEQKGTDCKRLQTSHAFHSFMMNQILDTFISKLGSIKMQSPEIPFISNLSGTWINSSEATDPHYWARHLRSTVRFQDGIKELLKEPDRIFLEVGPGKTLATFVKQCMAAGNKQLLVSSIRHPKENKNDALFFIEAIGRLWLGGAEIDWNAYYKDEKRQRVPLPTYPFEPKRYWIEMKPLRTVDDKEDQKAATCVVLPDGDGFDTLKASFEKEGIKVIRVRSGEHYDKDRDVYSLDLGSEEDCERLIKEIAENRKLKASPDEKESRERSAIAVSEHPNRNKGTVETLKGIFGELLGLSDVQEDDDFFELGGHSLLVTQLITRIHRDMNVQISMNAIFEMPTIKEISEYLAQAGKDIYSSLRKAPGKEYYPISSAQKRMFLLDTIHGSNTGYNLPGTLIIEGGLEFERLKDAVDKLIMRHEILRTSFEMVNGEPVQKINEAVDFKIEKIESEEKDLNRILKQFVKPFNLKKAPLLRMQLVKLSTGKHVLMYDMHHIISDGTSSTIISREIASLYEGASLPELNIQYKDFSEWQNELLKSEKIKEQEQYWEDRFKKGIPVLDLPYDFKRPVVQSFEGGRTSFEIDSGLYDGLKKIALASGATMYMVLLSAYNVLLHKYSGQEDIIIGSPIAGRNHMELQNALGMFINTLAMRNDINPCESFKSFLERVKQNTLKAYENKEYPFEELVGRMNLRKDLSRNPLFDAMLILQNMEVSDIEISGMKIEPLNIDYGISKVDLTLEVFEKNNSMSIDLEYCTRLFKAETASRMAEHFKNILLQIVENSAKSISDIRILSSKEEEEILESFIHAEKSGLKYNTVHEMFEEQVEKYPKKTAVIYKNEELTYDGLNQKANRIANRLRNMGLERNDIVGIMVSRSQDMLSGIMGILKAGCAYLPIDPEFPENRVRYMLEDSETKVLLTQSKALESLENTESSQLEVIDLSSDEFESESDINPGNTNETNDLAYVIYTSGSTGKPKGTMIEHKSVVNLIEGLTAEIDFNPEKTILALTTISFDIFVLETLLPLAKGMKIVIADENQQRDSRLLNEVMESNRVDMLQITPSRLRLLLNGVSSLTSLMRLKEIMVGGEAFPPGLLTELKERTKARIFNMYGPTETTVWSTFGELTDSESVDIGKPILNTRVYILDGNNSLVPVGVPGELCIAGAGLARGYFKRPALTEGKFVCDPFIKGEKMYRTGDLARWLPDGRMECLGRIDQQVKIRGYRIEPGEIEKHLKEFEGVEECVVVARADTTDRRYLVAYYSGAGQISVSLLRNHIARNLPEYMVPEIYCHVEKLPLTPNGKIDRNSLPEPDYSRPKLSNDFRTPESETEISLVEIWKEILKLETVGIEDNFFDLGGNSLTLVEMHAKVDKQYPETVSVADIFAHPTISRLGKMIDLPKENKLKDIDIEALSLPGEYLSGEGNVGDRGYGDIIRFKLENEIYTRLTSISGKMNLDVSDILLGAYIYMFSEISENQVIPLHVMDQSGRILPSRYDLEKLKDISHLIILVNQRRKVYEKENTFHIKSLTNIKPQKDNDKALLLFSDSYNDLFGDYIGFYDMVLKTMKENDCISCGFEYNAGRINKEKIKELSYYYLNILEAIMERMI